MAGNPLLSLEPEFGLAVGGLLKAYIDGRSEDLQESLQVFAEQHEMSGASLRAFLASLLFAHCALDLRCRATGEDIVAVVDLLARTFTNGLIDELMGS